MEVIDNLTESKTHVKSLYEINKEQVWIRLPVIVFICLLAVFGIVGNAHVLYTFKTKFKKSPYRVFVLSLSIVDMVCCCVSMPFEIVDELFPVSYYDIVTCKIFRFINTCVAVSCGFILVLIASERYRRICRPYGNQMSETSATYATLGVVLAAVIFTFPSIYVYGRKTVVLPGTNMTGCECTFGDHMSGTLYAYLYFTWILLTIIACMVSLTVIYSIIGSKLKKHNRHISRTIRKSTKPSMIVPDVVLNGSRASNLDKITVEDLEADDKPLTLGEHDPDGYRKKTLDSSKQNLIQDKTKQIKSDITNLEKSETSTSSVNRTPTLPDASDEKTDVKRRPKNASSDNLRTMEAQIRNSSSINDKEQRITKILFAITLLFILSFLPYVIILVVYTANSGYEDDMSNTDLVLYLIGLRLYMINSVANSILYGFFDPKFRNCVKDMYRSLFVTCKNLFSRS